MTNPNNPQPNTTTGPTQRTSFYTTRRHNPSDSKHTNTQKSIHNPPSIQHHHPTHSNHYLDLPTLHIKNKQHPHIPSPHTPHSKLNITYTSPTLTIRPHNSTTKQTRTTSPRAGAPTAQQRCPQPTFTTNRPHNHNIQPHTPLHSLSSNFLVNQPYQHQQHFSFQLHRRNKYHHHFSPRRHTSQTSSSTPHQQHRRNQSLTSVGPPPPPPAPCLYLYTSSHLLSQHDISASSDTPITASLW